MKTAVISGVAGMTGREVARQLMQRGWTVVGFDNFFASSPANIKDLQARPDFKFFPFDLNDPGAMAECGAFARRSASEMVFVHCAAIVHTRHFYQPSDTFRTNVVGMKDFLDLSVRLGATKFLHCSTSEVYSLQSYREGGVRESELLAIASVEISQRASYAVGKLQTEFFVKEACDAGRIRGCSIRFANVYSHDEFMPEHIIPYTIDALSRGRRITLLENARTTSRTFLHNRDSAAAVVGLIESDGALDGSAYNVGNSEEINIVRLVEKIAAMKEMTGLEIVFKGRRTADPERRLLNTEKIARLTGWKSSTDLDTGIRLCLAAAGARGAAK
jgi:nucleoside-diphosphate-sugar epimerase